jgi:hypothetical protein
MLPWSSKSKNQGVKRNGFTQPQYSIQHTKRYHILCYKDKTQDLHSSFIETKSTILESWIFTSMKAESLNNTENINGYTLKWLGFTQDIETLVFMFHLSIMSTD